MGRPPIAILLVLMALLGAGRTTWGAATDPVNCSKKDRESATYFGYYDPEDAYAFGREIQKLVEERDLSGLFSLVQGELKNGPRKKAIKGKNFSEFFSNDWRTAVLSENAPCAPMGFNGFMLGGGRVWYNRLQGKWAVVSLNGAIEESVRDLELPLGWPSRDGMIPPQCFVKEWLSSDNFEEFEDRFNIPKESCKKSGSRTSCDSDDFRSNPGLYLGKEIPTLDAIDPGWPGTAGIVLAAPLDLCLKGSVVGGRIEAPKEISISSKAERGTVSSKVCSSELACTDYAYSIMANVPLKTCQKLAPNLNGRCEQSFLVSIGYNHGGSMGWVYGYNIYGLFALKDDRRFIVPLKVFDKKNDALNYLDTIAADSHEIGTRKSE